MAETQGLAQGFRPSDAKGGGASRRTEPVVHRRRYERKRTWSVAPPPLAAEASKKDQKSSKMPYIRFCGAARTVTGSSHLLRLENGLQVLLDCGLYQGQDEVLAGYNNNWPYFKPADIDILVLSHAHIDHIGRVPRLVRDGFAGKIYCTHATRSLAAIMLLDAAKIQEQDALDNPDENPLYETEDVYRAMELFVSLSYERWHPIGEGLEVFFRDAGHILGSATVTLDIKQEGMKPMRLGFTGDVGRPNRPILKDPKPMPEVDYLICESTYGDRLHNRGFIEHEELLALIKETLVKRKGKLIIPAFSVGRTQELIYLLDQLQHQGLLPSFPVYVDSPLAINATEVFEMHPECYDVEMHNYMLLDDNPFGFAGLNYVRQSGLAGRLAESPEPCIIISAAGMMNAGRIREHLFYQLGKPENTLLVISYCAPNTLGAQIIEGRDILMLRGQEVQIRAQVKIMSSFSAHADRDELWDFIQNQQAGLRRLFLTHGEYPAQQKFAEFLLEQGLKDVHFPELGVIVYLEP